MNKTNVNYTGGEFIRHLQGSGWARVSRSAMDDIQLSIEAKGALGWLLTRPDGHRLFVRYAQQRLNISQSRWQRIRKELELAGYLRVEKRRDESGRWLWYYNLFGCPQTPKPESIGDSPVGEFSTGGKSIGGELTDKKKHPKERYETKEIQVNTKTNARPRDVRETRPCESYNKEKNNITTRSAIPTKTSNSSLPDKDFQEFVTGLQKKPEFQCWLDEQEERDRGAFRLRTHVYPSLYVEYKAGGWDDVVEALECVIMNGYRSFACLNGGETGEVV